MAIGIAALFAIGCGDGGESGGTDAPPMIDAPGTQPDAYVPPTGFTKLIGGSWSLAPGQLDTYRCVRLTIPTDTYITNIVAQAPPQSHHTVLSISSSQTAGPDGEYACSVGELGMQMLYASGLGTSPLDFPADVSVRIPAGTQIHLNLHLFNATDQPQTGESAIFVKSQATATPTLAEMVFVGKFLFTIPAGGPTNTTPYNVTGQACMTNSAFTVFAVWPHMHQSATHQKLDLVRGGTTTSMHNLDFDFNEQTYYKKSPELQVMSGDRLNITCTYINKTTSQIRFGDSSNEEMCFTGLYRYPALNNGLFQCTDTGGAGF
jgi:hypothetical protein